MKACLCRAVSSTYYALFHCLAAECADLIIGSQKKGRTERAWRQVYRSLEHGIAKNKCKQKDVMDLFPKEIIDFAVEFVRMQERRHSADYDPFFTVTKSEVHSDILSSQSAIEKFLSCERKHRKAFCAHVLMKDTRK